MYVPHLLNLASNPEGLEIVADYNINQNTHTSLIWLGMKFEVILLGKQMSTQTTR